jgi:hypothetical protein
MQQYKVQLKGEDKLWARVAHIKTGKYTHQHLPGNI